MEKVKVRLLIVGSICFVNLEQKLALRGMKGRKFIEKIRRKLILQDLKFSSIRDFIFTSQLPKREGKTIEIEIEWTDKKQGFTLGEIAKIKLTNSK